MSTKIGKGGLKKYFFYAYPHNIPQTLTPDHPRQLLSVWINEYGFGDPNIWVDGDGVNMNIEQALIQGNNL